MHLALKDLGMMETSNKHVCSYNKDFQSQPKANLGKDNMLLFYIINCLGKTVENLIGLVTLFSTPAFH